MEIKTDLYLGDSRKVLQKLPSDSVDLIVTSPPYADQRKNTYGGIHPDKLLEWSLNTPAEQLCCIKSITFLDFSILEL